MEVLSGMHQASLCSGLHVWSLWAYTVSGHASTPFEEISMLSYLASVPKWLIQHDDAFKYCLVMGKR
jgi:hypothetical protein